jgi:uncharacterized protein YllA (UPF0747 family)
VGGPTELAYLWQVDPIAELLGLVPSLRAPRISATFLSPPIWRAAAKAQLGPEEIFQFADRSPGSAVAAQADPKMAAIRAQADALLESIDRAATGSPPRWFRTSRETIVKAVARILERLGQEEQARRGQTEARRMKIADAVLPGGRLQERSENLVWFLNGHGPEFARQAVARLNPWVLRHQVVWVDCRSAGPGGG